MIAFNQLVKKLATCGYKLMSFTPGIWRDRTKRATFVLCVHNFSIKCFSKPDAQHLMMLSRPTANSPLTGPVNYHGAA